MRNPRSERVCRCGGEGWDGCRPASPVRSHAVQIPPLDALRLEAAVRSDEPVASGLMGALESDRIEYQLARAAETVESLRELKAVLVNGRTW